MSKKYYEFRPDDEVAQPSDVTFDTSHLKSEGVANHYSPTSAYAVGDFCMYEGKAYMCSTAIASPGEAWTAEHWTLANLSTLFTSANTSLNAMLPYGYDSANSWGGTATDGAINRMAQVTENVAITAPKPTIGKSGDFILRFSVSSDSAPTVTVNPPTDCTFTSPLYAISGDTIGTSGEYEMMIQIIPTATANTYDYIECVRKISE